MSSVRFLAACLFTVSVLTANAAVADFVVAPAQVALQRNFAQVQLVVTQSVDGQVSERSDDLTPSSKFVSSDPKIATVDEAGRVVAVSNGQAKLTVTVDGKTVEVPVTVTEIVETPLLDYARDIAPVLSKAGCNQGACHAQQYGQGGFKVSVFGSDQSDDREAIIRDRQQRRTNFISPEESLFLLKPTMQIPHGGGKRMQAGSVDHQILVAWLRGGAPGPVKDAPKVVGLQVVPKQRVGEAGLKQQLRVDATYSDGSTRDVTAWAKFDSMDEAILDVTATGFVSTLDAGQAPVMIRFEGQAAISMFVVPYEKEFQLTDWKSADGSFVDELAAAKFQQLGIQPSPLCDDATFVRRAFLDATGTQPTIEQVQAFLKSDSPKKREALIDELLGLTGDPDRDIHNDSYAAYWTLKWSDLIRNTSKGGGVELAMWSMHNWMKEAFRTNRPFDKVVAELVTAKGSVYSSGPANYFRIFANSTDLTEATAQLFLGVRLECAKCHHHPFEKYTQGDYYAFSAFFSRVGTKRSEEFGLFGGESVVIVKSSGEATHPKTRQRLLPTPLEGEPRDHPLDRRIALAEWLTAKDNGLFARNIANRYVGYLLGQGLVEPVDDMRSTNPPTNPELLDALAKHFVDSGFDLKQLIRAIMVSRLYQLSSDLTEKNAKDSRFYSHFYVKRLPAEVMLDSIDQATGSQTKFQNLPLGTRAIELPDAEYPNYFLNTFAKPRRASVCECERSPDQNLAQTLHILNGDTITTKLSDKNGRIAKLLAAKTPDEKIIEELYLASLCRSPRPEEVAVAQEFVKSSESPQVGYQDLLWALICSKNFLFVN